MRRILLPLLVMLWPLMMAAQSPVGNLFDPGTPLFEARTGYFRIIYSEKSREGASRLAAIADSVYLDLKAKLQTGLRTPLTVVITEDPELGNGFFSPVLYPHIVLINYRGLSGWFYNPSYLRYFFLHELAHAVSLEMRGQPYWFLTAVFGNWANPNYTLPQFMFEGVTVSFESLDGYGRVNLPALTEQLRTDIAENAWKEPDQATGAYDIYPSGHIYYHYGGLFSARLIRLYGLSNYTRLWKDSSEGIPYGFWLSFEKIYGRSFFAEWEAMKADYSNIIPAVNPVPPLLGDMAVSSARSSGRYLYISDWRNRRTFRFDPVSRTITTLFTRNESLWPDQTDTLALHTGQYRDNGVEKYTGSLYSLKETRHLNRQWPRALAAAFTDDGMIWLRQGPNQSVMMILTRTDGSATTLFKGHETLYANPPVSLTNGKAAFLMQDQSNTYLALLDTGSGQITRAPLGSLGHVRSLASDGTNLYLAYNDDFTFYRPAFIRGQEILAATNLTAGGFDYPMPANGRLYYIGHHAREDRLYEYPARFTPTNCRQISLQWAPFDPALSPAPPVSPLTNEQPYNIWPDLLPRLWAPYAENTGKDWYPDSIGVWTAFQDPAWINFGILTITYKYNLPFVNTSLSWENNSLPVTLNFTALDQALYYSELNRTLRRSTLAVTFSKMWDFFPLQGYFGMTPGAKMLFYATGDETISPYSWAFYQTRQIIDMSVWYSSVITRDRFSDREGFSASLSGSYEATSGYSKAEGYLGLYAPLLPVSLKFWGAYSPQKIFSPTARSYPFGSHRYPGSAEYSSLGLTDNYYFHSELEAGLLNFEIQRGPWLFPLYLNRVSLYAGARCLSLAGQFYSSVYTRAELTTTLGYAGGTGLIGGSVAYAMSTGEWKFGWYYTVSR